MNNKILLLSFLGFFYGISNVFAQSNFSKYRELYDLEKKLKAYSDTLRNDRSEKKRFEANDSFISYLSIALNTDNAFDYPFDSLQTVSVIKSPDNMVRLFTWVCVTQKEDFKHYGWIQYKFNGIIYNKELKDSSAYSSALLRQTLTNNTWFAALYYQLIPFKNGETTHYCLVGYIGMDKYRDRKVLDILTINEKGIVEFGHPVFYASKRDNTPAYRVVFEYGNGAGMTLRYEDARKMLVISHLSPEVPEFKGDFSRYLPDGTYDFYKLKKGKWVFGENLSKYKF